MPAQFHAPKGVAEYVAPESEAFLRVQDAICQAARRAGYSYVELPIFEDTAVFERGVGESTDVVSKEMYTFADRGGRSLTLRPEGTAGVIRTVVEHGLDRQGLPVKLWYRGPFFRAERPQQGRYRQFSQVGVEAVGAADPALDAEVISIAVDAFTELDLSNYTVLVNCLGDTESRTVYRQRLLGFLETLDLDQPTRERARLNPLRVLDDKRPQVQDMLVNAPALPDSLTAESRRYHERVLRLLDILGIAFVEDPRLVRGLDYYTGTTFEFVHHGLGAQSAIGGGGRYDGLVASLGGQDISGIGFGLGVDRIMLACASEGVAKTVNRRCDVYVIAVGEAAQDILVPICRAVRAEGVTVDMDYGGRSLKAAMRAANRSGARWAVIAGGDELAAGQAVVKDLELGEQDNVGLEQLVTDLRTRVGR